MPSKSKNDVDRRPTHTAALAMGGIHRRADAMHVAVIPRGEGGGGQGPAQSHRHKDEMGGKMFPTGEKEVRPQTEIGITTNAAG
jgi:hypothetical protein